MHARRRAPALISAAILTALAADALMAQPPQSFGGAFSSLEPPRQALVRNWVTRFTAVTGQSMEAAPFYDEILTLSAKTTFDAVTHALLTTRLSDASGAPLGTALDLVEYVETVRGEVIGAGGDRQFRMYGRLKEQAKATLDASREFRRGMDNTVYHKGYPLNYRQQGGVPSIQISIALDHRRADIDVDYRSASFPQSLFNGHLSSANSDVRAGNNADRHANRWAGLQNWWRSFFGVRLDPPRDRPDATTALSMAAVPRQGRRRIEVAVHDFLTAWLIEGNATAALSYVAPRALACVALESDDPAGADLGMAPVQLLQNLRAAQQALGPQTTLEGLTVGTRLPLPPLRVVSQPHHAQFVVTEVPDDLAAAFDCESRLTPNRSRRRPQRYGTYFGATFYIQGRQSVPVSLLWAKERGYWRIVSWRSGADAQPLPTPEPEATVAVNLDPGPVDPELHARVRGFYDAWLVRRDPRAAFDYLSPRSYACYDLSRAADEPASTSPADAGNRLRATLQRASDGIRGRRRLDELVEAPEPVHPAVRLIRHRDAATFSLTSLPDALADALECEVRSEGLTIPEPLPLVFGNAYGSSIRFRTASGDAPVLRTLWRREDDTWKLTSYGVETP